MNKQHEAAMALLDHLLEVQGAATQGVWESRCRDPYPGDRQRSMEVIGGVHRNPDGKIMSTIPIARLDISVHPQVVEDAQAIATAHNSQPALLAIAKGQLVEHFDQWECFTSTGEVEEAQYRAGQHTTICQHLASIQGESPEIQALRSALEETK